MGRVEAGKIPHINQQVFEKLIQARQEAIATQLQEQIIAPREQTWSNVMHILKNTPPSKVAVGYNRDKKTKKPLSLVNIQATWQFVAYDLDNESVMRTTLTADPITVPQALAQDAWERVSTDPNDTNKQTIIDRRLAESLPEYIRSLSIKVMETKMAGGEAEELRDLEFVSKPGNPQHLPYELKAEKVSYVTENILHAVGSMDVLDPDTTIVDAVDIYLSQKVGSDIFVGERVDKQFQQLAVVAELLQESMPDYDAIPSVRHRKQRRVALQKSKF